MAVETTVNYPTPIWVDGYQCRNCSDVELAKNHIDPAHPKSGPLNVDAKDDPTRAVQNAQKKAVQFGGALAGTDAGSSSGGSVSPGAPGSGQLLDLSV